MTDSIAIRRIDGPTMPAGIAGQIDAIFFAASHRDFASPEARAAFRERWLGRYLTGGRDVVLVAQDATGTVVGYLVGALQDPAAQPRFADIDYLCGAFRDLCRRFPAHLHINLAPAARSRGIGTRLVTAFSDLAAAAGAPGMHVVTARAARNVRFYARCGLVEAGAACWNGGELVFLARPLPRQAATRGPG